VATKIAAVPTGDPQPAAAVGSRCALGQLHKSRILLQPISLWLCTRSRSQSEWCRHDGCVHETAHQAHFPASRCREPRPRDRRHARDTSARRRYAPPSHPNAGDCLPPTCPKAPSFSSPCL
jgi:hypothetical protein